MEPWQYRSWVFPREPDFATKAARVLDLHARVWDGVELGPGDYVISADQKSQLQALARCHPSTAAGRPTRVEFASYRIVHEALQNVVKHAQAARADVQLVRAKAWCGSW